MYDMCFEAYVHVDINCRKTKSKKEKNLCDIVRWLFFFFLSTFVYFCLLMSTYVYFCLLLSTFVYFCLLLSTFVYFCLLMSTYVYLCLLLSTSVYNNTYLSVFFSFFSVWLSSVLRGHSVFSSPPQRPMTSDFEGFLYQILSITLLSYLNLWERASISLFNVEC